MQFASDAEWPIGRYYLRISWDEQEPLTCAIEFEPVVGAVIDTCNGQSQDLSVGYAYDAARREITSLQLLHAQRSLDVEVFLAEGEAPLGELHHDVTSECEQRPSLELLR